MNEAKTHQMWRWMNISSSSSLSRVYDSQSRFLLSARLLLAPPLSLRPSMSERQETNFKFKSPNKKKISIFILNYENQARVSNWRIFYKNHEWNKREEKLFIAVRRRAKCESATESTKGEFLHRVRRKRAKFQGEGRQRKQSNATNYPSEQQCSAVSSDNR